MPILKEITPEHLRVPYWRRARNQGHWFLNLVAPAEYLLVTAFFNIFPLPQFSGFPA